MNKARTPPLKITYYVSVILLMLSSMATSWLWSLPNTLLAFFAFLVTIFSLKIKLFCYDVRLIRTLLVYLLVTTLVCFFSSPFGLYSIFVNYIHAIVIIGVILLREHYKLELFKWFVNALSLILIITIPAWLLFLAGFHFPGGKTYVDMGDGFHYLRDYTFFVVSDIGERSEFLRFSSVFMEPGWVGTICCFVIFGLGLNFRRVPTWLCMFGLILSMSLSAVVNFIVCLLLWIWQLSKHRVLWLFILILSIIALTSFALNYNEGDNALNQLVVERLVFDEELGIAGNNRTNDYFDYKFESVVTGSDKWFGIGHEIDKKFRETNSWYNSASGIKKEILVNGIIGTGSFLLFLILVLLKYRSKQGFVFFVCFVMASFIRNMWRSDCYLVLYVVALCALCVGSSNEEKLIIEDNA